MKTLFISSDLLKWDVGVVTSEIGNDHYHKRPYEMVSHAESLLTENCSDFNLSDAIANLKRALNHRLLAIESHYKLKTIKFDGIPKGYLELLERYNLAKPFIIKRLMEIRNKIEHSDVKPPKQERCKELVDITWYFLKSTDRLVLYIPQDFELEPNSLLHLPEKYKCSIYLKNSRKIFELAGWFPSEYISNKKNDTFLKVTCSVVHDGEYWKGKNEEYHKDKTRDDIWIVGNLSLDENEKYYVSLQ